jgi:hypothetical protein
MIENPYSPTSNASDAKMLEKTKNWLQNVTMYTKKINKNTIVSCTNKEKIKEYEKLFK